MLSSVVVEGIWPNGCVIDSHSFFFGHVLLVELGLLQEQVLDDVRVCYYQKPVAVSIVLDCLLDATVTEDAFLELPLCLVR